MNPSKMRANEVERTPTTNDIILFRSPATWTWKARHETKIYEQWHAQRKQPELTTWRSWTGPWLVAQICKASKLAFSYINRNRRLGLNPRIPCTGISTGLLKTPRTQLQKLAKMTQHWYLS